MVEAAQKILLVDDRKENLIALEALLEGPKVHILSAASGEQALEILLANDIALVLLDVQMPGMDGFETASLMRSVERCRHIPIIFVTAISTEDSHVFQGYEAGAVDYLFKPLNPVILLAKVRVFLELDRNRRELLAKQRQLEETIARQEEYKKAIEEKNQLLKELAIRDGLTGIFNHRHFQELLSREVSVANRYHSDLSCLMLDLDHFKQVNDSHGHQFGDFVLREFVSLIAREIRSSDIMARYGGEEFALLLPNVDIEGARKVAEKIRKSVAQHLFTFEGQSQWVTVTIGLSGKKQEEIIDPQQLLRQADQALYLAKDMGRNRIMCYSPDPTLAIWEKM